ncbi:hypothetical protein [Streptomyces synnematoformans]|uniref:Transposase n=1 Tax=Streptomyces synnematoformans TaxID=415721 RepID=A0ABN2XP41_9ACTN
MRIRVASNSTSDKPEKIDRAEKLLQIPEGTATFQKIKGRRVDAESTNASLDSFFWNRRMIAYGPTRQTLVMLGFAMSQKATSRLIHYRCSH